MPNQFKKLNLGAGEDKKEGYINVDWNELAKPDVKHDLNKLPYPFDDSTFDEIFTSHILEHLDKPFLIMKEFHRLLKPGGKLILKVPHFSRGLSMPEHKNGYDITFPFYFNPEFSKSGYLGFDFKLEKMRMNWMTMFNLLPHLGYSKLSIMVLKTFHALFTFLANLSPGFCSRIWCFWVGGFQEIEFIFVCKKQ